MKGRSESFISSFESLPCFYQNQYPYEQQIVFIPSRKQLESHHNIQNLGNQNLIIPSNRSILSIQYFHEEEEPNKKNQQAIKTEDSLKQGGNKKKGGCVCKKTGCLKLYCECFRKGQVCGKECHCLNCGNIEENKDLLQDSKLIRKRRSRNSTGRPYCNCKKSQCQKKYCECFNAGISCAIQCRCQSCSNSHHNH